MYKPVSTYRIQFNKDYTLGHFKKDINYFITLGADIYASPVFHAVPGSLHGYDVVNPLGINSEIGGWEDFIEISDILKSNGTGWIQDIVPNHMALHSMNNWIMDVLEKGRSSKYALFFDIDFSHPGSDGKILLPVLGKELWQSIRDKEISIAWMDGSFVFKYSDYLFPVRFETFLEIINIRPDCIYDELARMLGEFQEEVTNGFINSKWPELKELLEDMFNENPSCRLFIGDTIESINADENLISSLLNEQNYRLENWRESLVRMNYRRFFTINSLICLRMENHDVFEVYHEFIIEMLRQKRFNGLRIDHIDGLREPANYLEDIRLSAGDDTYIITEKILGADEELPAYMPVQGTSGYDFLAIVNNLFTFKKNYSVLNKFYRQITGIKNDPGEIIYDKKKFILNKSMNGELENLCRLFEDLGFAEYKDQISRESIKQAIAEFLILFPVYRLYSLSLDFSFEENLLMKEVFSKAVRRNPMLEKSLNMVADVFFHQYAPDDRKKIDALNFFLRCMQFTGPLMAKGVEDTVMYYYNCFIGHNEVGDHPGSEGISASEYHEKMIRRQKNWSLSLNATSTHDTKRGEDVRARLNVITEIAGEWTVKVREWMELNSGYKIMVRGIYAPDNNEEYFIYQALAGGFPFGSATDETFFKRMDEYLVKSLREGKTNSHWNEPNVEHEKAVMEFVRKILNPGSSFLDSFIPVQKKISEFGIINSLSQLMLKATSPGIPDFYQGTELWDLSMVDPDNRRPVDYSERFKLLNEIIDKEKNDPEKTFRELYLKRNDGKIKLWLTYRLIRERKSDPELFIHGRYIPLNIKGKFSDHITAFARTYNDSWLIIVIPMFLTLLPDNKGRLEPGSVKWENTRVILPETAPSEWTALTGQRTQSIDQQILISDLMDPLCPVLIKGKRKKPGRSAGVLAHITSLPGKYGIGDLGEEAHEFIDILKDSSQSWWQVLPFNHVEKDYGYSPYSSASAFAGSMLFLSPDFLVNTRLIPETSLMKVVFRESDRTNFKKAEDFRKMLLDDVFTNFFCSPGALRIKRFNDFCENEKYWIDDFTLFICLKNEFDELPWSEWPDDVKDRDSRRLRIFAEKYEMDIKKEKLVQYLFQQQWCHLKEKANESGIGIIGDMSFYVNYDSSDVWAHPEFFKLDGKKKPAGVAGVPPDYFSKTGQLWGMPVYDWSEMKKDNYSWWLARIKRNLELCDLVRFDHFRGFSEYWETPYGEKTAINGKWEPGPGNDFFDHVRKKFPSMPFIAEDLGDVDEKVYKLRDDYSLPGMAVLQFAFGGNTASSLYAPHNHTARSVVYTGTHDNNTTRGWFSTDIKDKNRKQVCEYTGHFVSDLLCHEDFIRMAYGSVAAMAIIPVQDILGLDENARMNTPSTTGGNWDWKMKRSDLRRFPAEKLNQLAILFGRT